MALEGRKFGRGPRELGGSADLISRYNLLPHHELFCKKLLPVSITETQYLNNVVGDKEIRKGEGMELDQLFQRTSFLGDRRVHFHPFNLDILHEAFQLREATINLPHVEKGAPVSCSKWKTDDDYKKKNKKRKDQNMKKNNRIDNSRDTKNRNNDGNRNGYLSKQQEKRRINGSQDLPSIQQHKKIKASR